MKREQQHNDGQKNTSFSDFSFTVHYPEENPTNAVEDIVRLLLYLGVFDAIKSEVPTDNLPIENTIPT